MKGSALCTILMLLTVEVQAAVMSEPNWNGIWLEVTFTGESNRTYVFESSPNLQNWFPVLTNSAFTETSRLSLWAPGPIRYFRARSLPARPLLSSALLAKDQINISGGNLTADSFNSEDPTKSTNRLYDPAKAQDHGDLIAYAGISNSPATGSLSVKGSVHTGHGAEVILGPLGVVGDTAWVNSGQTGIQPGHHLDAVMRHLPDVIAPFGGVIPGPRTVGGVAYHYVLDSGNYRLASMASSKMLVLGNAQLFVTGTITMTGNSAISIAPGATLSLFAGNNVHLGGNGIINQTGTAANFRLYGLPACQNINLAGNGTFAGVIYAPSADLTLIGSGAADEDFSGAAVLRSITLNGHWRIHFDEALQRNGPSF